MFASASRRVFTRALGFAGAAGIAGTTYAFGSSYQSDPEPIAQDGVLSHRDPLMRSQTAILALPASERFRAKHLFNGRDLTGWRGRKGRYWNVSRDGSIVAKCSPDDVSDVSTYLISESTHKDFRLLFEMRLVQSEMHSGVGFWGQQVHVVKGAPPPGGSAAAAVARNVAEVDADTGKLYSLQDVPTAPGGEPFGYAGMLLVVPDSWGVFELLRRWYPARIARTGDGSGDWLRQDLAKRGARAGAQHGWNRIELLCTRGERVRVAVNGVETLDFFENDPDAGVRDGPIALQLHWMPKGQAQEIRWRGLVIVDDPQEDQLVTVEER